MLWRRRSRKYLASRDGARDPPALNRAGFFQSAIRAVLVDRLQPPGGAANSHKLLELRHPDAMRMQVRLEETRHIFRDMAPDTAFLLGHTAPMNNASARGFGT